MCNNCDCPPWVTWQYFRKTGKEKHPILDKMISVCLFGWFRPSRSGYHKVKKNIYIYIFFFYQLQIFFVDFFKVSKVRVKTYWGHYWEPKMALKTHKKNALIESFFFWQNVSIRWYLYRRRKKVNQKKMNGVALEFTPGDTQL